MSTQNDMGFDVPAPITPAAKPIVPAPDFAEKQLARTIPVRAERQSTQNPAADEEAVRPDAEAAFKRRFPIPTLALLLPLLTKLDNHNSATRAEEIDRRALRAVVGHHVHNIQQGPAPVQLDANAHALIKQNNGVLKLLLPIVRERIRNALSLFQTT